MKFALIKSYVKKSRVNVILSLIALIFNKIFLVVASDKQMHKNQSIAAG
jgi:hypothetical protein